MINKNVNRTLIILFSKLNFINIMIYLIYNLLKEFNHIIIINKILIKNKRILYKINKKLKILS